MGGAAALRAATADPSLKAAVGFCPFDTTANYAANTVPSLIFAGSSDITAGEHPLEAYLALAPATLKMFLEVSGRSHSVANNPAGQSGLIGRYGLSWLKVYLEGDDRYAQFLVAPSAGQASDFRTNL